MLAAQLVFVLAALVLWHTFTGHLPDCPSYFLGLLMGLGVDFIGKAWRFYGLDQE